MSHLIGGFSRFDLCTNCVIVHAFMHVDAYHRDHTEAQW